VNSGRGGEPLRTLFYFILFRYYLINKDTDLVKTNMTLQILEHAVKSFEDLCPEYSKQLARWDTLTPTARESLIQVVRSDPAKCIVGQAHGGSHYVNECHDCEDFASFNGFLTTFDCDNYQVKNEAFESMKEQFVSHMNRVH
jgi:hypothetical protein